MAALFGSEIRRLRTASNMSQDRLGEVLGYTGSLIGQIETGRRTPTLEFAERLDGALETSGLFTRLWPHVVRGPFPDYFQSYAEMELRARRIQEYGGPFIPGLAQTEDYARHLFRAASPLAPDEVIDAKIATRVGRQQLLTEPTRPMLWWLLDEIALRRPVGGHRVMADQLTKLAGLIRSRAAVVQVIEIKRGAHAVMEGAMTLMSFADGSPDVAYTEG
ncbi:Scr1 family TA system antitoxin-like transcriptional regulator [Kitasatospora sp. NPDC101801]|uniref:helix-turn-helix domain-containing protein n=1 Tax=Kitasatospora sp. NPDC101801 TaxID=3364103 RepID=UPI003812FE10